MRSPAFVVDREARTDEQRTDKTAKQKEKRHARTPEQRAGQSVKDKERYAAKVRTDGLP